MAWPIVIAAVGITMKERNLLGPSTVHDSDAKRSRAAVYMACEQSRLRTVLFVNLNRGNH